MINARQLSARIEEAGQFIKKKISGQPVLGIILGSGLDSIAGLVREKSEIPYREIPHFPVSTVQGHAGKLAAGIISGRQVLVFQGRFHYYEGYCLHEVTFPVRLLKALGGKGLIVTNAAGGINSGYGPGDLVILEDHINLMGVNPLRGENITDQGPRFPDLSRAYTGEWRLTALEAMKRMGLKARQGTYAAVSGPSYETPAEIRFLRTIGADLVGMSTVPEVIVANHCSLKVLGISCVTNMAAGILDKKLDHQEVLATAQRIESTFTQFIEELVGKLDM